MRRSSRRTRTISAAWREGTAVISVPWHLPLSEEAEWIETMIKRLTSPQRRPPAGDEELMQRARELSARYLEGRARPTSVRWVTNQNRRWGSASAADGTLRLSHRLRDMPPWVVDAVLVHELAHLIADDGHGPRFKAWEARYPRRLEANAFLAGVSWAIDRRGPGGGLDEPEGDAGASVTGP